MKQIPSDPRLAIISGDFEQIPPMDLYAFFTEPGRVVEWWPHTAEMSVEVGGEYHFAWPDNDWHLRGTYTALDPGKHLAFTWHWDHEPSAIVRKTVDVWIDPLYENGSRLAIHHGPFGETPEEQGDRQGIIEGWIHFGMRLAGLREGRAE